MLTDNGAGPWPLTHASLPPVTPVMRLPEQLSCDAKVKPVHRPVMPGKMVRQHTLGRLYTPHAAGEGKIKPKTGLLPDTVNHARTVRCAGSSEHPGGPLPPHPGIMLGLLGWCGGGCAEGNSPGTGLRQQQGVNLAPLPLPLRVVRKDVCWV